MNTPSFSKAFAALPRYTHLDEVESLLARYKEAGFTGIWIENDYLRWSWEYDPDNGFGGNWRLWNLYDFTRSKEKKKYEDHLRQLGAMCRKIGLELAVSFWLPKLNAESRRDFAEHNPKALGLAVYGPGHERETWCTCPDGEGIHLFKDILGEFLNVYPEVTHLKVSIKDNSAFICTHECPNSHGATEKQNAARVFQVIQDSVRASGRPASALILYPWFWEEGFEEEILQTLKGNYQVLTKYSVGTPKAIEADHPAAAFFDASLLADKPGDDFERWHKRLGASRIVDMLPMSNSMDAMFVVNPPTLALVWRRWQMLKNRRVASILDFECGGSPAASTLTGLSLFQREPELETDAALTRVAAEFYGVTGESLKAMVSGWKSVSRGWENIPLTLAATGCKSFSGRLGQAWPVCAASPLVHDAFAETDQKHRIHWFSPYNLINFQTASRLQPHFATMEEHFKAAYESLRSALRGVSRNKDYFVKECRAVHGLFYCAQAAALWCKAALAVKDKEEIVWKACVEKQKEILQAMQRLHEEQPDFWANNCWHPHQMPISQNHLGFQGETDRNAFVASLRILSA